MSTATLTKVVGSPDSGKAPRGTRRRLVPPSAEFAPAGGNWARKYGRHVLVRCGRGDFRLSAAEAEELARQLAAAAEAARGEGA